MKVRIAKDQQVPIDLPHGKSNSSNLQDLINHREPCFLFESGFDS